MEANNFVAKLKADGSPNDLHDLENVYTIYKELLGKLPAKDKGLFSLNVLCILCRNIDKVQSWRDKIDVKALLTLAIDCVRESRVLEQAERVKTLACVYHIHKFVVRQPSQFPPELVLKLSYMPFEYDHDKLLTEYCKTYWNLLADRLMYMEKLKSGRRAIIKLLPKLTDDIQKVIHMYDTIQFCNNVLVFLLKKLHFLYNTEYAKDLNGAFGKIFESLSLRKDVKAFKKLSEKEILELYVKFSDSFYVITENATKLDFKDSVLSAAVRTCISFIGHAPDMFHCLQTFYLNAFCCLLADNDNSSFNDTVLNSLIISCETSEKLGYLKAMKATYPYINQLLRVYIEYNLAKSTFTEESQEICLKMMILLLDKLKNTEQLLKCDNCRIKSGLHDALRLSFLAKNFVSACLNTKLDVTLIMEPYHKIIAKQHSILTELCRLGCSNHEKCLRKLQTDIHNTAILLNKAENFDSAIKLFDLYLTHEFLHFKTDQDLKNISRALYNKSICELDSKSYERALLDAFLSLIFAQPDGLNSEKHMSLVMDIKAKALKGADESLQMMTVLDACCVSVDKKLYGNLKPFFCNLEFSTLLQHEFTMYAKLWPSLAPVAGVWRALHELCGGKRHAWMCAQSPSPDVLYSTIIQTPTYVRTIHNPHFAAILSAILDNMRSGGDVKLQIIEATLLFLKAEMNMAEAAAKHEWKIKDQYVDPECVPCCRSVPQEHAAVRPALRAVALWTAALPHADDVPVEFLSAPLQVLRASLQQLLHVRMTAHALQLAHVALRVAQRTGDRVAYLEATGVILSHANRGCEPVRRALAQAAEWAGRMSRGEASQAALLYVCDAAIFYHNTKQPSTSAKLIRLVQARLLQEQDSVEALPLAAGRLLDAQALGGDLSAAVNAQRHYLTIGNNGELILQEQDSVEALPLAAGRLLDAQALGDLSAAVNAQRHYLTIGNNGELILQEQDSVEALPLAAGRLLDAQALGDLSAAVNAQRHYLTIGNNGELILQEQDSVEALPLAAGRLLDAQALGDLSAAVNAQRHYLTIGNNGELILQEQDSVEALPLAAGRLLDAQALGGDLSAAVNAQRHYLTIGNNGELILQEQDSVEALPLAAGRLLDAQALGDLSAAVNAQRHYLTIGNNGELILQEQGSVEALPLAAGRLLDAQALGGDLSAAVNAQRHYLTIGNNETNWCARHRLSLLLKRRVTGATERVVSLARHLRLRRRARAAAAAALPAAAAHARLALCVAALDASRSDVARATIDQRLKHILGLQTNEHALQKPVQTEPRTLFTPPKQIETMRDAQILRRNQTSPSIPIEYVPAYKSPDFYEHGTDCPCYACETPSTLILACQVLGTEASVYFRAKEFDIAKNYFEGVLASFCTVENKLKASVRKLKFERYILDIVEKLYEKELLSVQLEVLMEASYFELSQKNYSKSDDYIYVRIHEILQVADVDGYSRNEVMNLMTASEVLRKADKITDRVADIENDLENLKLTPTKEILKTPEAKPTKPPVINKVVVNKEELPDLKCKIPVLNFDEPEEQIVPKKKINFKIPVPITSRPVLETITPRPTRSKVNILVTEPSEEKDIEVAVTPQPDRSKAEFFTPESTPDQFFTPQTSVKTYATKSLRHNIVKNLEVEFSTKDNSKPKELPNKENVAKVSKIAKSLLEPKVNVETGSLRRLKRSTSPGKLPKEDKPRTRRLRQPAVHVDKDEKK